MCLPIVSDRLLSPRNLSIGRKVTLQSTEPKGFDQSMSRPDFHSPYFKRQLAEALEDSPVVLSYDLRQCGKINPAPYRG